LIKYNKVFHEHLSNKINDIIKEALNTEELKAILDRNEFGFNK